MLTFKQLEAVYWVAQLGGFSQAAHRLHTTQSAISKRIQELESIFSTELFDRSQRTARLTDKGEDMLLLAKRLLSMRDEGVEQFSSPEVVERRVRIGVTELTAMTWLPRLVDLIPSHYPKVIIEPVVDLPCGAFSATDTPGPAPARPAGLGAQHPGVAPRHTLAFVTGSVLALLRSPPAFSPVPRCCAA